MQISILDKLEMDLNLARTRLLFNFAYCVTITGLGTISDEKKRMLTSFTNNSIVPNTIVGEGGGGGLKISQQLTSSYTVF